MSRIVSVTGRRVESPCFILLVALAMGLSGCDSEDTQGPVSPHGGLKCTNENGGDYPGCGVSKSTYSSNDPITGWNFLNKYFPVETPTDECESNICQCPASGSTQPWEIQQGRVYAKRAGVEGSGGHAGNGFGLHLVNVSQHWTTGGKSTAEVEAIFSMKLGNLSSFDAFMDFNVVFATDGLQAYKDAFASDGVPHLVGTWTSSDGKNYTSIIIQVPSTQMILELVQQTSLTSGMVELKPHALEQRVSSSALRLYEANKASSHAHQSAASKASSHAHQSAASSSVGSIITPLAVNRAASAEAMSKLEDFYISGMGTQKTHDSTVGGTVKKCFQWTGATVDVCFTQRPDSATAGEWKVIDFENMLNTVHGNIVKGHPFCGMDKWEDNHYAVDSRTIDPSSIVSYINTAKPYHYCEATGDSTSLHYVWDPTGWGIQLNFQFASAPDDCTTTRRLSSRFLLPRDNSNPACDLDLTVCPQ